METHKADARLIAVSPKLLEFAKAVRERTDYEDLRSWADELIHEAEAA